ncbi:ferritin-like domain-containing protein [Magnetospirillum sulfuroxidans]|uniref:DUF2202 domain-containing protein n=1 Tax=Magnetospirillum sulfuroxidans TaxID=611300 RepID=A0ABS5I9S1_9PROT|nr:DUF2202 domain-containing protein [Magnetospirillum sulfuroxidans]MBR9971171.1 DUF2202 domain-containing protein [Magnetospirillum sulfuroxidans]
MSVSSPIYQALCAALDDEYKARATYAAVIDRFGPVRPFINIIQSEQRHINALQMLFRRRDWSIPADPYGGMIVAPASLEEACRLGVQAEIDNVALYDRLNRLAADDAEVLAVFANLQQASQERHLPAFQRGDTATGGGGCGHGGGRGNGRGGRCL